MSIILTWFQWKLLSRKVLEDEIKLSVLLLRTNSQYIYISDGYGNFNNCYEVSMVFRALTCTINAKTEKGKINTSFPIFLIYFELYALVSMILDIFSKLFSFIDSIAATNIYEAF